VDSSSTKNKEHHEIEFRHASQLSKWSGRHMPLSAFSSDIVFPLSVTRSVNYSPARCTSTAAELMLIMICQIWLLTGRVDLISPLPLSCCRFMSCRLSRLVSSTAGSVQC
jgi:hypothetical protein